MIPGFSCLPPRYAVATRATCPGGDARNAGRQEEELCEDRRPLCSAAFAVKSLSGVLLERAIQGAKVYSCPSKSTCALTHALTFALEKPHFSHEISTNALFRQFWTFSAGGSGSRHASYSVSKIPIRRFSHVSSKISDFSRSLYAGQVDGRTGKKVWGKKMMRSAVRSRPNGQKGTVRPLQCRLAILSESAGQYKTMLPPTLNAGRPTVFVNAGPFQERAGVRDGKST